ncbi:MAG: DUF2505 domain-containing protein [Rubrivivax sp.]|nr:DUF2505 domain-containing protein [Rubrivivax sp.]
MIEFKLIQSYPAGIDRLWAAFGRPDYPVQKYLALGATAVRTVRFIASAQAIEVELERDVPVDPRQLPSWARWLAGRRQTLRHRSAWRRDGPTRATAELHIALLHLPVQARALGTITETSAGASRMVLTWRVSSDLPLVGARVERLFVDLIRTSLDADHAFTLRYLQAHGS